MRNYEFFLYSNDIERRFDVGDPVFVRLKTKNRAEGRGWIVATPDSLPPDSVYAGRWAVRYIEGVTAHVRPERLFPVFRQPRLILVCASTDDYRRLARSQVNSSDVVLEMGCSYGLCTEMLALHAAHVIGIDNSEESVAEARRRFPHLQFEVADVIDDPSAVINILANFAAAAAAAAGVGGAASNSKSTTSNCCNPAAAAVNSIPSSSSSISYNSSSGDKLADASSSSDGNSSSGCCNVVFADIGGNRQLEALLRLIPWILGNIKPRLLVVKSEELAEAAARQLLAQQQQLQGQQQDQQQQQQEQEQLLLPENQKQQQQQQQQQQQLPQEQQIGQLLQQQQQQQQLPGEIQDLQQQLQAVTVAAGASNGIALSLNGILGNSSSSRSSYSQPVVQESSSKCSTTATSPTAAAAAVAAGGATAAAQAPVRLPTVGQVLNPETWWQELEAQCRLNPKLHARAEPWFLKARANGFARNPLRYPQRFTAEGVRICRPHNYEWCKKSETCDFDHTHCHHCGVAGHRAMDCPVVV